MKELKKGDKVICMKGDKILDQIEGKIYTFKSYYDITNKFMIYVFESSYGFYFYEVKSLLEIPDDKLVAFRLTGNIKYLKE